MKFCLPIFIIILSMSYLWSSFSDLRMYVYNRPAGSQVAWFQHSLSRRQTPFQAAETRYGWSDSYAQDKSWSCDVATE